MMFHFHPSNYFEKQRSPSDSWQLTMNSGCIQTHNFGIMWETKNIGLKSLEMYKHTLSHIHTFIYIYIHRMFIQQFSGLGSFGLHPELVSTLEENSYGCSYTPPQKEGARDEWWKSLVKHDARAAGVLHRFLSTLSFYFPIHCFFFFLSPFVATHFSWLYSHFLSFIFFLCVFLFLLSIIASAPLHLSFFHYSSFFVPSLPPSSWTPSYQPFQYDQCGRARVCEPVCPYVITMNHRTERANKGCSGKLSVPHKLCVIGQGERGKEGAMAQWGRGEASQWAALHLTKCASCILNLTTNTSKARWQSKDLVLLFNSFLSTKITLTQRKVEHYFTEISLSYLSHTVYKDGRRDDSSWTKLKVKVQVKFIFLQYHHVR